MFEHTIYGDAVVALNHVHAVSGNRVPCKPVARVVSDGNVIGLTTQTHQLVRTRLEPHSPLAAQWTDGLPVRYTSDPDQVDEDTATRVHTDPAADAALETNPHAQMVLKIQLDGDMYDAFLQTARRTLNLYEHRAAYQELKNLGQKRNESLTVRRARAVRVLRELLPAARVEFVEPGGVLPAHPVAARRVLVDPVTRAWHTTDPEDGSEGALVLPARLFAHPDKRTDGVFFLKLADQCLRHRWLQVYLFRPEVAYLFGADQTELRADETVVALASLTPEYFRSLVVAADPRHQRRTIYDFHRAVDQMPPAPIPQL